MHWLDATLTAFDMIPTPNAMGEAVHHIHKIRAVLVHQTLQLAQSAHISSSMTAQLLPT